MSINAPFIANANDRYMSISVRYVGSWKTIEVSPSELARYNSNPDALVASHLGMTVEQYVEWIELDGAPLCGAMTKAGKQCKNLLGRIHMSPKEWLALHREQYCACHGR